MATLTFIEALMREPNSVDGGSVDLALQGGASPGALEQASLMVALFAYMNRMVDAFGADVTPEQAERIAGVLNTMGGVVQRLGGSKRAWKRLAGAVPEPLVEQLEIVRTGEGDAPQELRTNIEAFVARESGARRAEPGPVPPEVDALIKTLSRDAHGVTDAHIEALKDAKWSEESIYEMIFVASFAAGLGRMERAVELLAER